MVGKSSGEIGGYGGGFGPSVVADRARAHDDTSSEEGLSLDLTVLPPDMRQLVPLA